VTVDRREFLHGTMATLFAAWPAHLIGQQPAPRTSGNWDPGRVRHLLPTVSDSRILVKTSFTEPLPAPPTLRVGTLAVRGRMNDTAGECWQFFASGLEPARQYRLSLTADNGTSLCEPWDLSTFPSPDARPARLRLLCFTCAGGVAGPDLTAGSLPTAVRNRLLRRGLSFGPDAVIANGDHVYWDLHAPRSPNGPYTARYKSFDRGAAVFGTTNEDVLKRAAAPQIVPVYGTDFRSTPVFFLQDDHDHFDNDEGTDVMVTFPPPWFHIQLARATQQMYYPEFLASPTRPANLPWSSSSDRGELSESFGTLRYGRLAEILLYDVRRTMTLAGPTAVFVDPEVERWLQNRTAAGDVTHVVHAPSNPFGWSAGKWGEWYPDVLGADGRLTAEKLKPHWQSGWLSQHDRIVQAIAARNAGARIVVSGDLHAIAYGRMRRAGVRNLDDRPIAAVLSGPIGTSPVGWPSSVRGVAPSIPAHLDLEEAVRPIEQHGFTLLDFTADTVTVRLFRWDVKTMPVEAIDRLEPFHTAELPG
jgi:hypothetical protein